jgi:hypothetical protein
MEQSSRFLLWFEPSGAVKMKEAWLRQERLCRPCGTSRLRQQGCGFRMWLWGGPELQRQVEEGAAYSGITTIVRLFTGKVNKKSQSV